MNHRFVKLTGNTINYYSWFLFKDNYLFTCYIELYHYNYYKTLEALTYQLTLITLRNLISLDHHKTRAYDR